MAVLELLMSQPVETDRLATHLSPDDLRLYLLARFDRMELAAEHLLKCQACRLRLLREIAPLTEEAEGKPHLPTEHEGQVRVIIEEMAILRVLYPATDQRMDVNLIEVSHGACRIELDSYLAPATKVQLRCGTTILSGEIRYCRHGNDVYHAGIRISGLDH